MSMNANEIIKALENILKNFDGEVTDFLVISAAIDLISDLMVNNERLKYNLKAVLDERADYSEPVQEFIKRFEKKIKDVKFTIGQTWEIQSALKEVEKEMVGEG